MRKEWLIDLEKSQICSPHEDDFCTKPNRVCDTSYSKSGKVGVCVKPEYQGKGLESIMVKGKTIVGTKGAIQELQKKISLHHLHHLHHLRYLHHQRKIEEEDIFKSAAESEHQDLDMKIYQVMKKKKKLKLNLKPKKKGKMMQVLM